MSKQIMTVEEMKSRLVKAADTSGCFQYCTELNGTVTADNLQTAWYMIRDRAHPEFDSVDRIEFVMELEYELDINIDEDEFEELLDDERYKPIDAIAERMIRYVQEQRR